VNAYNPFRVVTAKSVIEIHRLHFSYSAYTRTDTDRLGRMLSCLAELTLKSLYFKHLICPHNIKTDSEQIYTLEIQDTDSGFKWVGCHIQ